MRYVLALSLLFLSVPVTFARNPANVSSSDLMPRFHEKEQRLAPQLLLLAQSDQLEEETEEEWEEDWDDDLGFYDEEQGEELEIWDPLHRWNRAVFAFNDRLYGWVLIPVSKGYRAVVPDPVRSGAKNVYHNLAAPVRFAGCLLQGKVKAAGGELASLVVNSTVGVLGIFDITKDHPVLDPPEEDTGQAFATWGIGNGFYIVWPLLGPSTFRDSLGSIGDRFLDPVSYLRPAEVSLGVATHRILNEYSYRIGDYETLKAAAIEPYEAFRDAYIQLRAKRISE